MSLIWPNHVLHRRSRKRGKVTKARCIGSICSLLNEKDLSSIKQDVMQSSFTTRSQLIVSRRLSWWKQEKSFARKYMCHLDHHRRFHSKIIGWKNWIQKSLEAAKIPNESNQNSTPNNQERRDPWVDKNPHKVAFRCLQKNKEEDQTRTRRPVKVEELDINFRVPGLSDAVVKEAEHFRVQELVKKIENFATHNA